MVSVNLIGEVCCPWRALSITIASGALVNNDFEHGFLSLNSYDAIISYDGTGYA